MDPPLKIVAPPVPATSKSSVPPERFILLLIETLPPELGKIPNTPALIVKGEELVREMVRRSPANMVPADTKSNGVTALTDSTFVTTLVVNVTEPVPDNILIAPIV